MVNNLVYYYDLGAPALCTVATLRSSLIARPALRSGPAGHCFASLTLETAALPQFPNDEL